MSDFLADLNVDGPVRLFCTGCKTSKPEEMFSRHANRETGRNNWCKLCQRGVQARPEYRIRRHEKRRRDPVHSMWIETRARAKKLGLEFDIEKSDIVIPFTCPVLGIELRFSGKLDFDTPTLDRWRSSKGYVKGNVRVISWRANCLKRDCDDPAVFEAIARYIRNG